MNETTVAIAKVLANTKKIVYTKADLKLLDAETIDPPPKKFVYDESKRVTRVIARQWGSSGWIYKNQLEESFCFAAAVMHFNQAGFDNFIEERLWDTPISQKNLQWLLGLRTQALEAFKKNDKALMQASFETMNLYQEFIAYDEAAREIIELGLKFKMGRKPGVKGPLRKALETLVKKDPKIPAAKAWQVLQQSQPAKMEFTGSRPELREIWLKGKKLGEWPYFQKLLSQVKSDLKQ